MAGDTRKVAVWIIERLQLKEIDPDFLFKVDSPYIWGGRRQKMVFKVDLPSCLSLSKWTLLIIYGKDCDRKVKLDSPSCPSPPCPSPPPRPTSCWFFSE